MSVRYEIQLTPLFNEQGELVLLYLEDKFDELWMYQDNSKEQLSYEIQIEYVSFFNEDERIKQLRQVYQLMKEKDGLDEDSLEESSELIEWNIPQYVDSFLNLETVIEDITDKGTLRINNDSTSFLWLITQPEWLERLAKNQYRVMVNIVTKGDEGQ